MKYAIDKKDRYTVFRVEEENLNSMIAPDLKTEFVILKNEGIQNMILDLEGVKYVDSSGLSAILTANRLWSSNGTFVIAGSINNNVKKLIEISRLESVLTVIPTLDESVDYVMMEELERELKADPEQGAE